MQQGVRRRTRIDQTDKQWGEVLQAHQSHSNWALEPCCNGSAASPSRNVAQVCEVTNTCLE